ncbi:First ORF in transposon ISC1058 [Saccharolobus solfataricus P2]|uniref:First ORF in transposon ISC1058 n=2 Tax=Saccharolobus solfataricus TaxID=2287 RepID=Q97XJ1_SACS2|nr:First ORF in transposon ISC1058 [Saccharolobus solfataricus P2]SAI85432.1 ORF1 in transposon ISC1058 [Saccharolobus solfataricus]
MGKSKYKRDWSKYDENVITRYKLMFPFYVFEHWWDLLAEENRNARTKYKAPKEFNDFLAFLHIFLPCNRRSIKSLRTIENHPHKPRLLNNMGESEEHEHNLPRGK